MVGEIDYSVVVGVDNKHLSMLCRTWPTWKEHKPSLLNHPMIVFYDRDEVNCDNVHHIVDHPNLQTYPWPHLDGVFFGKPQTIDGQTENQQYEALWSSPQRYKMLAGFVHIPDAYVKTHYWLKLDCCVFATGQDDWIDPNWFEGNPVIISHRWGYTKPADQMLKLDQWVRNNENDVGGLASTTPLNLVPSRPDRIDHRRIISWCAFFKTNFTKDCSLIAERTCGPCQMPVPSQDGFLWYVAKRAGLGIKRVNMKKCGWDHRPVRSFSMDVLKGGTDGSA